jgi:hypothetical protein
MPRFVTLLATLLLAGGSIPAGAQDPKEKKPVDRPAALESRERWERLPPAKRREIQEIYDRIQKLPPQRRKQLLDRLRAMDPAARRAALRRARERMEEDVVERPARAARSQLLRKRLESLPPAERERLRKLPPEERRRQMIEKTSRRRQDIISRLPEAARKRAEALPPREQAAFLRRLRGEQVFLETFRDPREIARLQRMPPRKLAEALGVARDGTARTPATRPGFLSEETWRRWLELEPFEKSRVLRQLIQRRPRPPPPSRP